MLVVWRHESNPKSPANLASLGDSVIISVIALVVLNGVPNAGDCPRSNSAVAVATSLEAHQKADEKTEAEA